MAKKDDITLNHHLRQLAEKSLEEPTGDNDDLLGKSPDEIASLIHELRVHQIELEMQNKEMRRLHDELEKTRNRFSDLYDFSPVGHLSISEKGIIKEANLTIASMLNAQRSDLIGNPLTLYILREDQDIFYKHRMQLLETQAPHECNLRMVKGDGHFFYAHFFGMPPKTKKEDPREIRVAISDITERLTVEEALQKSEKAHRDILDNISAGVIVHAPDTTILYCNKKACELLQRSFDQLIGKTAIYSQGKFLNEDGTAMAADDFPINKSIKNQIELEAYVVGVNHSGNDHVTWLACNSHLIYSKDGELATIIISFVDITERKKAEETLMESELRFTTIFHRSPAAIAIARLADSRLFDVNNAWQEITGFSKSEAIGHTPFELNLWVNPDQRDHLIEMVGKQGSARSEMKLRHRSGKLHEMLMSAEVIELMGQEYLLTMAQDITEINNATRALNQSKQKFESMVNEIGIGVALISPKMEVVEVNHKMRQWFPAFDSDKRSFCYQTFNDPPHDQVCDNCPTRRTLDEGRVHEYTRTAQIDGNAHHLRIISSPILNESGEVTGAIEMVEDITDRLKMEKQIRQSQKLESIGTLAGGIAHDFNNILSSILGFTELAMDDAPQESLLAENLRDVYAAGIRAKELVQQILMFSRQSDDELKPIQVDVIAKEVMKLIHSTTPTTIGIEHNLKSKSLITGNPTQIHQLILNLCTNAVHAMQESGGTLSVILEDVQIDRNDTLRQLGLHPGDYLKIVVGDTGTGIDSAIIGSIFEPYFTTKVIGEGTGMGLAIIHGIVESYGGKITVNSTLGVGTVFTVYLPICKKRGVPVEYIQEKIETGVERILFVDDEAPIVEMSSAILRRLGYSVTNRTSSLEALALFSSKPNDFDLVISDMTMPNMTGDKLAIELMRIRPDIPVVLCTGYSKQISDKTASDIGIKALIYKPITKLELAKIVRKAIDEAKSNAQGLLS